MVGVAFTYDESASKWDCIVTGATDEAEARHAFSAVVLTIGQLDTRMLRHTIVQPAAIKGAFYILPAI